MPTPAADVAAIRAFNRFYTSRIGALDRSYLGSDFSLAEARVLYELRHRAAPPTAADLVRDLGIDAGYLSRILRGFARRGLVARRVSPRDARRTHLALTARGTRVFDALERHTRRDVRALVEHLPARRRGAVVAAMRTIQSSFHPQPDAPVAEAGSAPELLSRRGVTVRSHRPGDMGWVVHRHGVLYAQEYGWDERFEALVARICADFIDHLIPAREHCWIAERDGEILGSIFCVRKSNTVAKLRLLLVEPTTRGLGVGTRLVDECIRFARSAGYRTLTLWTQNNLHAARRIYERAGFRLTSEQKHTSFGKRLVAQNWDLRL